MLLLLSSAAFLFSKEKDELPCKQSMSGIVKEVNDNTGFHLYIETPEHKIFYPIIENESVILSAGSKVRVCYDNIETLDNASRIRINHVSYLP